MKATGPSHTHLYIVETQAQAQLAPFVPVQTHFAGSNQSLQLLLCAVDSASVPGHNPLHRGQLQAHICMAAVCTLIVLAAVMLWCCFILFSSMLTQYCLESTIFCGETIHAHLLSLSMAAMRRNTL
jgi:hypothetical protein